MTGKVKTGPSKRRARMVQYLRFARLGHSSAPKTKPGPAIGALHMSDTGDETGVRPPPREGKHLGQKFDQFTGENFWTRLVSPTSPV
jgi:hypothetical protein